METSKNKKDSVFSGIFPSSEHLPPPETTPHVYKPVVSEEQVAALNNKIELMERNIVKQLEKKLAEPVPHPPPPPPPALAPAVISRIEGMENCLKEFQEKFLLGAVQMKNIEESKISARREIEELLKVVREQQKYSELDRQMHDQLEKAWTRVEEMEKRMLAVYSAAAAKQPESSAPAVSAREIAAEALKAVDARFEERLKALDAGFLERLAPLEAMLKNAAVKTEAGTTTLLSMEGRAAELSTAVEARLAGFSSEIQKLRIETFSGKERVEEILAEVKKDVLSSVRNAFADNREYLLKKLEAVALDERERLDTLAKLLVGHLDELYGLGRDNAVKMSALEHCVISGTEKALSAALTAQQGIEKALCARIDEAAARSAAENALQLERIKEACGLAVSSNSAIGGVMENIAEIDTRLGGLVSGLKTFMKALEPVNMEALLGVSGALVRRSFESAAELVAGLERESIRLAGAKDEISENLKKLAPKRDGEIK